MNNMSPKFACVLVVFLVNMSVSVGLMCLEKERLALLSLKQGLLDSSWGRGEDQYECCKWEGVVCSNRTGHVLKLDLPNKEEFDDMGLQGMISPSLAELRHLNYLDLSQNCFNGTVPRFIGSLTHLKYLNLSGCCFKGKLPDEFGSLFRLQYLDLNWNSFEGEFPSQLLNLSRLKYLDLHGYYYFNGVIPHRLGNLSCLQHLYISGYDSHLRSNLEWVHYLPSLSTLSLEAIDLSPTTNNWMQLASNLPLLKELKLSFCNLPNEASWSISDKNSSRSLVVIDISGNELTSSIFRWLFNFKSSLVVLDLSDNLLDFIPKVIANFSSLKVLKLEDNQLRGGATFESLCNLHELHLSGNKLSGQFDNIVPICAKKSLRILDLQSNQITGTMPDLSQLSFLQELYLSDNNISGTFTESIGSLSNLEVLDVGNNSFEGVVTEAHFMNLSKLIIIDLSYNALALNISAEWVPPFQLWDISLSSCKVGPRFPMWLLTQKRYYSLEMSRSRISNILPTEFWNLPRSLRYLDLSHNQMTGEIPNVQVEFDEKLGIDLSSNLLHGPIPSFLAMATYLQLNHNKFTNSTSLICTEKVNDMLFLDLSNNNLVGIPDCWHNFKSLSFLHLGNNNISGRVPSSMGFLTSVEEIYFRYNNLTGEIPFPLSNCKKLVIFDVGHNKLSGHVPSWIGDEQQNLEVLILKSNQFYGSLPTNICLLTSLQILDLSLNNISGSIPRCINKLTAMTNQIIRKPTIGIGSEVFEDTYTPEDATEWITWKGKESEYKSILGYVINIDLSSNNLSGEIPRQIMNLVGLVSLNISRNKLSGNIPSNIGQLNKSLEVLDLSRNFLFGTIPSSLSELHFLSVLDVSYNNLSGRIPTSTQIQSFDGISFIGNTELCGEPLPKHCPNELTRDTQHDQSDGDSNQILDHGFYISMALGFIVGFWGVLGSLCLNESWRHAYYKFLRDMYNTLHVLVAVSIIRLQRRFNGFKVILIFLILIS